MLTTNICLQVCFLDSGTTHAFQKSLHQHSNGAHPPSQANTKIVLKLLDKELFLRLLFSVTPLFGKWGEGCAVIFNALSHFDLFPFYDCLFCQAERLFACDTQEELISGTEHRKGKTF